VISRDTIEEVKSRIDIVDVLSDYISLKKSGQNYKALSPFTNEKTPSFFVVPAKGIFKDFSSGKGGDAITFLMEHEGMTYVEVIRHLAKKYGVAIKEEAATAEETQAQTERESLFILLNFAKDFYCDILVNTSEGQSVALTYLRERGFTDPTIAKFELGYAPEGWDNLRKKAAAQGYNPDLLEKAGLLIKKEDGSGYDRFRGRVIFPVHNVSGKVLAFGARMLGKDKNQPKYINSPETEVYHKSHVLYGLFQAKNAIRNADNCYLVEGYTDVISMHQAGVENVVAASGTALSDEQVRLIKRFTENITVLFDGDAAGIKAALRGIDMILRTGLNVRVLLFPDGEDPDSYSRKVGSTAFQQFLRDAVQDFVSFKAGLFAREAGNDPIRKAESIKEIVSGIAVIPDPVRRSVYIRETSNQLKISESVLLAELNKLLIHERRKKQQEQAREQAEPPPVITPEEAIATAGVDAHTMVYYQERETIRLLLNYADQPMNEQRVADFLLEELDDVEFSNPAFRAIYAHFREARNAPPNSAFFINHGTDEVKKAVAELVTSRYDISAHWADKYNIYIPKEKEVLDRLTYSNVIRLKFRVVQKMMDDNLAGIREAEKACRWDELDQRLTSQEALKKAERDLATVLGIVVSK
jgi:DNA primase